MMVDMVEFREHPSVNERCFVLIMISEVVCGCVNVLVKGRCERNVLIVVHGAQLK